MEFKLFYEELTNSTEMIRALLSSVTQEEAGVKPNNGRGQFSKWFAIFTMKSAKIFENISISFYTAKLKNGM